MATKRWKVTISVTVFALFMMLWGGLNIITGSAYYFGGSDKHSQITRVETTPMGFVTRADEPGAFWMMVGMKFFVGASLLAMLGNAHLRRLRKRKDNQD